jgi:hypothetical protein
MAVGLNKGNLTLLMPVPQVDAILECVQRYRGSMDVESRPYQDDPETTGWTAMT